MLHFDLSAIEIRSSVEWLNGEGRIKVAAYARDPKINPTWVSIVSGETDSQDEFDDEHAGGIKFEVI